MTPIYIYIYVCVCVCLPRECFGNIMQCGMLLVVTVSFCTKSHFCIKWIALFTNFKTFKTAYHLPQSWVTWIQSMPFQPTSIRSILTLNPLTCRIWWIPNNASKWQMGFNSAFKGLISASHLWLGLQYGIYFCLFPDQFHHWPLDSGQQILAHFTIQIHILAVRHKRHWAKQCHCNAVFALIFL